MEAIEEDIARNYQREVPSADIGDRVMKYLRRLDHIAYVRFASVYRQFKDLGELIDVAQDLKKSRHEDPSQKDLFAE